MYKIRSELLSSGITITAKCDNSRSGLLVAREPTPASSLTASDLSLASSFTWLTGECTQWDREIVKKKLSWGFYQISHQALTEHEAWQVEKKNPIPGHVPSACKGGGVPCPYVDETRASLITALAQQKKNKGF